MALLTPFIWRGSAHGPDHLLTSSVSLPCPVSPLVQLFHALSYENSPKGPHRTAFMNGEHQGGERPQAQRSRWEAPLAQGHTPHPCSCETRPEVWRGRRSITKVRKPLPDPTWYFLSVSAIVTSHRCRPLPGTLGNSLPPIPLPRHVGMRGRLLTGGRCS